MARRLVVAALFAVLGCTRAPPPAAPQLLSVSPAITDDRAIELEILGDGFEPAVSTDFRNGKKSTLDAHFTASLVPSGGGAKVALSDVTLIDIEVLRANVPAGLARGTWDLLVVDPSGHRSTLPSALRVVSSAETVAGFRFEPIGLQRLGVPFFALLTAIDQSGQRVDGFDGVVTVTQGASAPVTSAPFALGRGQVELTPAEPGSVTLTARDALGHQSSSSPYEVRAGLPVRARVLDAPANVSAGGCAGPVQFELEDALGNPADLSTAMNVELRSHPGGAQFFSSAGCAGTAIGSLAVSAPTELYFRAPSTGTLELQLLPEAAIHAVQSVAVLP